MTSASARSATYMPENMTTILSILRCCSVLCITYPPMMVSKGTKQKAYLEIEPPVISAGMQ